MRQCDQSPVFEARGFFCYHISKNLRRARSSVEGETKYSVVTASQLAGVQR